jgi:hypothetical protein
MNIVINRSKMKNSVDGIPTAHRNTPEPRRTT